MSLEAASERMKIEMMSEEGDDDERKAKDKILISEGRDWGWTILVMED